MKSVILAAIAAFVFANVAYSAEPVADDTVADGNIIVTDDNCVTVVVAYAGNDEDLQVQMRRDMMKSPAQPVVVRGFSQDAITECNKDKNPAVIDVLGINDGSGDVEIVALAGPERTLTIRVPRSGEDMYAYISRCFSPEQVGEYEAFFVPAGDQAVVLEQSYYGAPRQGACAQ